ncbi:MAG TPA: NAD(P)/FAD-dependent oxidoreductase [Ktedonobacterales bacterium]|nr:NAD(P)/FAD-dependent oxidoreductase [Ktedonobacterales bacterium]
MATRPAARQASTGHPYDAVVIGAGPNGLAAAITLARAGCSVIVYEAKDSVGGGSRTQELTLPGFAHDVCSAIHPYAVASPFFKSIPLERYGVEWVHPPAPLAHPLPDGRAAVLERAFGDLDRTLGPDAAAWRHLIAPQVAQWDAIVDGALGPIRPLHQMRRPFASLALARFGLYALQSIRGLAERSFEGDPARALLAGIAAHAMLPLDRVPTAAAGVLMATMAHVVGWPLARGGSQTIVDALAAYLRELGGEIVTGAPIASLDELPPARAILADVTPRQLLALAGDRLPAIYSRRLGRYRYGPGVFKMDFALDGPIPWHNPDCLRAATVHVGGTLPELAESEQEVWAGKPPERPFVLLAQQSLFDASRAPAGKHTAWAYCHVPAGSDVDMAARIEAQIERFAPGFRDRILARHTLTAEQMESYNPNYIGGDINGGLANLTQLFTRPIVTPNIANPYATPVKGLYLCSSSTPPGGGVHGLCGYFAARAALRSVFGKHAEELGAAPQPAERDAEAQNGWADLLTGDGEAYVSGAGKERA